MGKLAAFLKSCVATPFNIVLSILTALLLAWLLPELIKWALIDAVWSGNSSKACEGHDAACWVFIRLRFDQLLYGPYPTSERWRVDVVAALAVVAIAFVLMPVRHAGARKLIGLVSLVALPVVAAPLLAGGFAGLKPVPTVDWGGIMLNIVIAAWSIATAIPLGLLLALGRRSEMPVIGYACATFIELWRSLPLIGVLFLAVVMFPLFVPPGFESDRLVRALIAFTLFNAAIFAEVFRGGLQAIPHGQREAARSLGLGYWRMTGLIVLPQVVRIVMPGHDQHLRVDHQGNDRGADYRPDRISRRAADRVFRPRMADRRPDPHHRLSVRRTRVLVAVLCALALQRAAGPHDGGAARARQGASSLDFKARNQSSPSHTP